MTTQATYGKAYFSRRKKNYIYFLVFVYGLTSYPISYVLMVIEINLILYPWAFPYVVGVAVLWVRF